MPSRESLLEYFRIQWIASHGCALVYHLYEIIDDDDDDDDDGNYGSKEYCVFIDRTLEGSNWQDGKTVADVLGATVQSRGDQSVYFILGIHLQGTNQKTIYRYTKFNTSGYFLRTG